MPAKLTQHSYGKSAVRLTKVRRLADRHELVELEISVELIGSFADSYLTGDNRNVIPTDTMKNTMYALAAGDPIASLEEFGVTVGRHFAGRYAQVESAIIELAETAWSRLSIDGKAHPHAFATGGAQRRRARVAVNRDAVAVSAGIEGLSLLKTADSAFTGFVRDEFTTLAETTDRIFATTLTASWTYDWPLADVNANFGLTVGAMVNTFATHKSLAVQQTLYAMGEKAIAACPAIRQIELEMTNQHRIPVNLSALGLPNQNEIFVPTAEPFGVIRATLSRA